jgi:hypothetical protein
VACCSALRQEQFSTERKFSVLETLSYKSGVAKGARPEHAWNGRCGGRERRIEAEAFGRALPIRTGKCRVRRNVASTESRGKGKNKGAADEREPMTVPVIHDPGGMQ